MTAPCVFPDVSTMQSVRHTPTCIPFGGWYVQGVEIAWPVVSGASSHLFPVGISSSCQCKRIFSMGITVGTAQDQVWHFLGPNGAAAQCLTGQTASVLRILARLHIHTGRLGWRDFGFEFWDLQRASASARPCSMGPTLLRRALGSPGLDAAGRPHSPQNVSALPRSLWPPRSIRSAGSSTLYHRSIFPSQSINSNPIHTHLKQSIVRH